LLFYLALQTHVFVALHIALKVSPIRAFLVKQKFRLVCALPKFHIIASNHDVKNSLREFVPEKKWREIPIAYTGVNTSEIKTALAQNLKRDVLLEKFGIPKNRLLVFSLANIIERKGFRVLLEAAKQFKNENLFFVWIGDGENRQEMQRLITELGLENNVGILRPAEIGDDRQDLLQVLRLADIFVHPSFAEGLPGAMLEAMALGKAVVASAVNAIPEAIENGENGFLVEAGDAAGIAQAISLLANDSALRKEFGKKAQERVLNSFTEENCAEITIEHYKTFWQNASSKKK
jgi:hypothetical protein